ncbi:Putative LOC101731061 (Silurana), partial [Caligus rogercresseyi]
IIAIDFSKAFDTIQHRHIFRSIKKKLPKKYFNPIRALLYNGTSTISMGGIESDPIILKKAVVK